MFSNTTNPMPTFLTGIGRKIRIINFKINGLIKAEEKNQTDVICRGSKLLTRLKAIR
jgi:hypothetical protein